MEYTKQQIEGNILELILEKVNSSIKPLEENLVYFINKDPDEYADIIKLTVEVIQKTREEVFSKYGVKPRRFEVDNNCENLVSENELCGRITEGFRQWNHQWDYYMMTNKNKPINIEKLIYHFSQLYKISNR